MKQIKVNSKCNGCGLCIMNCTYLEEDDEGNARPVAGMAVKSTDIENVEKVIGECPEHALQIIETGTRKVGMEGVKEVIDNLEKKLKKMEIKKHVSVPLDAKDYYLSTPSSDKEFNRDYTSEGSAKSAARDEFRRLCYSENAYKPMIKKILVEYKVRTLKPYYDCEDEPESAYYIYNDMVRKYLTDAYAEISDLIGERGIPDDWKNFNCYLSKSEWAIKDLEKFEENVDDSAIMDAFKGILYNSLDDYISGMDFECDEIYDGDGLFGNPRYKKKWYFSGFYDACSEFIENIKWSINYNSYEIAEHAERSIESAFDQFEEKMKKEIEIKIEEIKRYVENIPTTVPAGISEDDDIKSQHLEQGGATKQKECVDGCVDPLPQSISMGIVGNVLSAFQQCNEINENYSKDNSKN